MAEENANPPTAVAAARPPPFWTQPTWKKRLLALFVGLALIGLIIGLIVAFKPEGSKAPATTPVGPDQDKIINATTDAPSAAPTAHPTVAVTPAPTIGGGPGGITEGPGGSLPGAKVLDQLNGFTTQTGDQLAGAFDALGLKDLSDDTENFFNTLVKDTSMAGGCTPQSGAELRAMLEDPNGCTVISLLPGMTYNVALPDSDDDITISSRKVVVGNPIALPTIDGADAKRIFHIVAGGNLDLQFVRTFRGGGELIATIPVLRGGTALVEIGGRFSAFGVIFTNAPPVGMPAILIAPDISRAVRVFGGQIFVTGGIVTITLSHFWVLQPGVLLREIYVIGADMLVVAGVAVLSGCTFTNSQLFINGGGVGFQLAVLGGVLIASGVTFTINFMAIHASGAGILSFVGGGVAIMSGVSWSANLGALAHFGSGIAIFVGGGVLVISGGVFTANLGVAIECGTGVFISLGGGTLTATGIAQELSAGVDFYAGAGVLNWVGAGSAVLVGFSEARNVGVAAVYGIGGTIAVGAGVLVTVGSANADNYGVASIVLIGGDYFLGAGIFVEIGSPMVKNAGVLFAYFLGYDAFVGYGAAVVRGSPASVNTGVAWIGPKPGLSQYFINGQGLNPTTKGFTVDSKGNIVPKGDNKTDHFKSQGFEAFNALKGDCWINNPKALLGDDDEEMYDDDSAVDDDVLYWDDDLAEGEAAVMAFGDDDDSLLSRDDDDKKLVKPRDDDDGGLFKRNDDMPGLIARDDDVPRLFPRDDDVERDGLFGGGKDGPIKSMLKKKCKRVCKIEKMRIQCTPLGNFGEGFDDEYFDDDMELDDDLAWGKDDDIEEELDDDFSFGDDDVEDVEAADDDFSFGADDDVEDVEAPDDDAPEFGADDDEEDVEADDDLTFGADDDVEASLDDDEPELDDDVEDVEAADDDISFGGDDDIEAGGDDDLLAGDDDLEATPDDDVESALDDDVEEPELDDDIEEEFQGGGGLDDDIEEPELDDDIEEPELDDDIEEKELDDDIEEEELDDDIEEEELDDDIEEEELDDDIEEEEMDDDIEEEELDDDIEEEEMDDDIEEEELDDDIEEEELDDDIEEEEMDDDIEEEELDDDIEEEEMDDDIEEEEMDDDIEEEEMDDDIEEEEEMDDDIEEEELDDDIEEEEELDDDIEEEEEESIDDDVAEEEESIDDDLPNGKMAAPADDDVPEEEGAAGPDATAAPTPEPAVVLPEPNRALRPDSAVKKLRPFQRLREAAAGSLFFSGRKAQEEGAGADAGADVGADLFDAAADTVTDAVAGSLDEDLGEFEVAPEGEIVRPLTSFVVLDGENAFDKGTPNAFVEAVRASPVGAVAQRNATTVTAADAADAAAAADAATATSPAVSSAGNSAVYAAVNGDVYCNMCGFKNGVLDFEVIGESNQACNPQEDSPCTLEGVKIMGLDGQGATTLPSYAIQAGQLFDGSSNKLLGQLNTDVVTATMRVGCSSEDAVPEVCVQTADLEKAIAASLGSDCARTNVVRKNQEKHPELVGATPSNAGLALPGSANTDVFDVSFTSHNAECTAAVTQWLNGFQANQLNESLDAITPEGITMDQAAAEFVATHSVKGMNFAQANSAALDSIVSTMRTGVAPSVLINSADASASKLAFPSLAQGEAASMAMTGFMRGRPVTFELTSQCSALGAAKIVPGTSAADAVAIGQFTPTAKGAVNVPFKIPTDLPAGTYSVRATQSGFGFCSQPFEVKEGSGQQQ